MSLLQRWSLPSRGFVRDKSHDEEEPTEQAKYPTMHLGQLGPRRRGNLSSVFSTLFEKPESRHNVRRETNEIQVADDLPLLASRRENIRPDADSGHSRECEHENPVTTIGTAPLLQGGMFTSPSRNSTVDVCSGSSPSMAADVVAQSTPQASEKWRPRCFSLSSTTTHETVEGDEFDDELPFITSAEKAKIRERCLSASSSYPSEGMRSPMSGHCSPEPATSQTMKYFSEYRRFGQYPSKSSWHLANTNTDELPASGDHERNTTTTSASSATETVTPAVCTMASQAYDYRPPAFPNSREARMDPTCADRMQSDGRSSPLPGLGAHQKPSSTSEVTVPILENEDAISSRIEVSFMSYRRPQAKSTSSSSENQERNTARGLHPSEGIERTMLTAVRQRSLTDHSDNNDDDDDGACVCRSSRSENGPRGACFKTRARFELVGRPVSVPIPLSSSPPPPASEASAASSGSKFTKLIKLAGSRRVSVVGIGRRRKWRLRMKRVRRSFGKKKNKGKKDKNDTKKKGKGSDIKVINGQEEEQEKKNKKKKGKYEEEALGCP
ncbi:hypothetical protein NPX13_g8623 [Xylaria arbuscula]|uniref:Uncharacterized protein n=1 Tax=Xylaria arbuscula TaxID=114810 RepID=A0A9W8N819_9PEZI|nr:hypothetical protein NPX13_g8623 [Xylaria arbuscula]